MYVRTGYLLLICDGLKQRVQQQQQQQQQQIYSRHDGHDLHIGTAARFEGSLPHFIRGKGKGSLLNITGNTSSCVRDEQELPQAVTLRNPVVLYCNPIAYLSGAIIVAADRPGGSSG